MTRDPDPTALLRVAVPNKGSLSQSASEILRESGYRQRQDSKELTLIDAENGVEFFYLRPRDIALYVGEGTLDVGITGRDLLLDSGAKAEEVLGLGFGRSRFHFAGPRGRFSELADLAGQRIATSYVGVVRTFLEERGIDASVTRLDGAVETSIQLGVADVIADVVETGSTLKAAGLETFGEVILDSEAVLVTRGGEVPRRLRGLPAPDRGRPGRPQLRDDGLRHPHRERHRGRRPHPRHRGPDHRPVASRGLGRRPGDGAPRRLAAADGRALRHRCPRHPADRHPCLPTLRSPLPHTWRPLGVRLAGAIFGTMLLVVCAAAWLAVGPRDPGPVHHAPAGHGHRPGDDGVRRRLRPGPVAGRRRGRPAGGGQRLPAARARRGPRSIAVHLPPGAPWAVLDLADGTSAPAMGIQGSDGARARTAVRELRAVLARSGS